MRNNNAVFLTVSELTELLRIGRSSAYELCNSNQFPVLRVGKTIRIPKKGLHDWIDEQAQQKCS
ncbi:MAG TPA: DNA-binding protein [Firmicutes bacterium]|nr:DNA-binding protein [Bacillota bacterium]